MLEAAQQHQVDLRGPCRGGGGPSQVIRTPNWTEDTFGEGPTCYLCHVQIPPQFNSVLPPVYPDEQEGLEEVWDEEFQPSVSRLACQIKLTKEHDGLVVLVPDPLPTDII